MHPDPMDAAMIVPEATARSEQSIELLLQRLEVLADARRFHGSRVEVLTNAEEFYTAELDAIANAAASICMEAYIFHDERIGLQFRDALAERARAGVRVCVLADSIGNWHVPDDFYQPLRDAGAKVAFFRQVKWVGLLNRRSHRELLVVDGRAAFIGGAGISDRWRERSEQGERWRDTMFRIQGDAVPELQAIFTRAWFEAAREAIKSDEFFPEGGRVGDCPGLVVNSHIAPTEWTPARVLTLGMLETADDSVCLTTPYFIPDEDIMLALLNAGRRGVRVRVLLPAKSDHLITLAAARDRYPAMFGAGIEVYEYQPTMIHAKALVVDGQWSLIGSMNFDQRSMFLNEEVMMLVADPRLARDLERDFEHDVQRSRRFTMDDWKKRPAKDRAAGLASRLLSRQL